MFDKNLEKLISKECGCHGCQDTVTIDIFKPVHERSGANGGLAALDGIGCNCGGSACTAPETDTTDFENSRRSGIEKCIHYGKENWQLGLSFIVFFYGLISGLENQPR